jgi:hypothetical protein
MNITTFNLITPSETIPYPLRTLIIASGDVIAISTHELENALATADGGFKSREYEDIDSQLAGYVDKTALLTLSDVDLLTLLDLNP